MRKDTIIIAAVSVIITATVAGTGYYLNAVRTAQAPAAAGETTWTTLKPHPNQPAGNAKTMPEDSAETSRGSTDTPIKCYDPEVGEFWTNAARCEGADLNNRITIAESPPGKPAEDRYSGKNYETPAEEAGNSRSEQ